MAGVFAPPLPTEECKLKNSYRRTPSSLLTLLLSLAIGLSGVFLSRAAAAYNVITHSNGTTLTGPEIVPFFWGNWPKTGDPNDQPHMEAYLKEFASYVSGQLDPVGMEPTVKQYGVWGATVIAQTSPSIPLPMNPPKITDATVAAQIHAMQRSGVLPANTQGRIYVAFIKGFPFNFTDDKGVTGNTAAYHGANNGTYYVVMDWDLLVAKGFASNFQGALSHELQETMTDPVMDFTAFTATSSWTYWTSTGLFSDLFSEIADQCSTTTPMKAVLNAGAITVGTPFFVSTVSDNVARGCNVWSRPTTSKLTAIESPPGTMNVFWPVPARLSGGGKLGHAWSTNGSPYQSEIIGPGNMKLVGKPSAVSTQLGRLDVYAQDLLGLVWHLGRVDHNSPWTWKLVFANSSTPPSAVSGVTGHTDVVVRNVDSSLTHYVSDNNDTFTGTNIGLSNSVGAPQLLALGSGYLNVFTYSSGLEVFIKTFTPGKGWAGGGNVLPDGQLLPAPMAAVYAGTRFLSPPFNEALFVAKGGGMGNGNGDANATITPLYTPYMTATNGSSVFVPRFGTDYFPMDQTMTPYGSVATGAYTGNPAVGNADQGIDLAWWDYGTRSYKLQHFSTNDSARSPYPGWQAIFSGLGPTQSLGGVFVNPPVIGEESSGGGYTEVFGVGTDNCLWVSSFLGRGRLGTPPPSPSSTGICNIF